MDIIKTFRTLAPEFRDVDDISVQDFLNLTLPLVSKTAFGVLYEQAVIYLTAHRMKMAGLGESGAFGKMTDRAGVTSFSEGATSVSFGSIGAANAAEQSLNLTSYGQEYLRLQATIIPITVRGDLLG